MSDFLTQLLEADAPVAREVVCAGKTGTVYFRRISAGEKAQLVKGQKVHAAAGQTTTMEFDVSESMQSKHMLVQFSVCHADGKRFFKTLEEVRRSDAGKIEALYKHASEVNKEDEDDPGKS